MDILNAATNAVDTVKNTLSSSGLASGLGSTFDSLTGKLGSIGSFFKPIPGVKLPLANPLFAYASYDYVIGLGCLSAKEVTNPDSTYMAGKPVTLICKSANADPSNRVQTPYGKFDFFIASPAKALFDLLYFRTNQFRGLNSENVKPVK